MKNIKNNVEECNSQRSGEKIPCNIRGRWGEDLNKFSREMMIPSVLLVALALGTMIYFPVSIDQGTYNPLKWKSYSIEQQEQNLYRKQFQRLDLNNDAVIDSTEFIYRGDRK